MFNQKKRIKMDGQTTSKKNRYSDSELEEFKNIILLKIKKANEDLRLLMDAFSHIEGENSITDTSPNFKGLEEGHNVMSKEENSCLAARQQRFINDLERALVRIKNKTYGICKGSNRLIPRERLLAAPHATMCVEVKEVIRQKELDPKWIY